VHACIHQHVYMHVLLSIRMCVTRIYTLFPVVMVTSCDSL